MIKRKQKYERQYFTFWLTEYEKPNMYDYDIIFASSKVAPPATRNELIGVAEFIKSFLEKNDD